MSRRPVASVSEFIEIVNKLASGSSHGKLAAFRGQTDATWPLLPAIVRRPFDATKSVCLNPDRAVDKSAEQGLFLVFRGHAYSHFPQWVWLGNDAEIAWKQIIIAQHYRLPTRLLDWSTNPLVALFFLLEGNPGKCRHRQPCECRGKTGAHHGAVFVLLKQDTFSAASLAKENAQPPLYKGRHDPGLIRPPDIDRRIAAQGSLFSIGSRPTEPIQPNEIIPIDEESREPLLRQLDTLGINRRTLFPDLEGISDYLKWSAHDWVPDPGYLSK